MTAVPDHLVAQAVPGAVPNGATAGTLRVLVPSLAHGGAERIVIEWLAAEALRGRGAELAILHRRRLEYRLPAGIAPIRRGCESVEEFLDSLGERWRDTAGAISAHLVPDALLARLWSRGVRTVPVLHNSREGWRNDPAAWPAASVPMAVACAESVRVQAQQAGCRVPVVSLRHRPAVGAAATDEAERRRIRAEWNLAPGVLVVGVVGAFKTQKDHGRAVEVLAHLRRTREAYLVILGGSLDAAGFAEIDRVVSRAAALGVGDALRLPGFVQPVEPWYAAFDALLNVSRHEGLSIATQEALAAGIPVVAAAVGGQGEIAHPGLCLLPANAAPAAFADSLAAIPVREKLVRDGAPRFPRAWSLSTCWRRASGRKLDTLFATANLNAGGAQRSLVNLSVHIAARHRFAIAVCGETTHAAFPAQLAAAGVERFRPAATADPFETAEGILARATASDARNLCFWNVDPRVKLLVARFAPPGLALIDASPGAYAYEELHSCADLARAIAFGPAEYYRRLDCLVTKYDDRVRPSCRRIEVVVNGVAPRVPVRGTPAAPRFVLSGRLAPSKRVELVIEAFRLLRARFPAARLDIVGQAEPRHRDYLASLLAAASGLPVAFRGAQPGLGFLDEPFTAAVVMGTHQGCPNAVLEAMASGLAVIANDSGGTRELVRHGETGWLLPEACTAAELASALAEAAADAGSARRLGESARAHVARHHDLEFMATRYLSLFGSGEGLVPQPQEIPHGLPRLHAA